MPVGRLRPLTNEVEIDLLSRVRVSRIDDEVDGAGYKGRIPCAHQLFRRLAFASAVDDRLAAGAEKGTGTTGTRLNVFSHRPQITQFFGLRRIEI